MKRAKKNVESTLNKNTGSTFVRHLQTIVSARQLFKRGATVIVGVSGGPDSVALLHLLWELRYQLGIKLVAVHFNHRLRRAAASDEKFVIALAERLQIPAVSGYPETKPARGSLEDWARRERLGFLLKVASQYDSKCIALAHTQDDLAETVIMRILRGTGLMGLRGILHDRLEGDCHLVRPLLDIPKSDLLKYLKIKRLAFRIDRSNLKTDFFRNKIRLQLLPLLKRQYNPNIHHVLADLSQSVSTDYDFLSDGAEALFSRIARVQRATLRVPTDAVLRAHAALRRMIFRQAYQWAKGDLKQLTLDHIDEIEDLAARRPVGAVVDLPSGVRVARRNNSLEFHRKSS